MRAAWPGVTVTLALVAVLAWAWPALSAGMIYDRALLAKQQWWRLWTGHLVHYGISHLFWNLAVFVPVGCWLERGWPGLVRWFYVICPLFISGLLLAWDPTLTRYAGLSGVATGAIVLLAGLQLRRHPAEPAWFWLAVLALVAIKIVAELVVGTPLIVSSREFTGIRNVPLSHLGGLVCAALFWGYACLRDRRAPLPA